ncbi:MAG: hypothetical protein ACI89X_000396 [Planctomycetota bacterium]|jgi:hypothetical protein
MFKKSLLTLMFCGLLTLAGIVAYTALGLHTPEDTIREAQAKLSAGQYAEVVTLLDRAALGHSLKNNRSLMVQLWLLRLQAHSHLGNMAGALKDVQKLLDNGLADDVDLLLDQIRFLASDKQGDMALLKAEKFLEAHPEHSRGLELAGEAGQTAYQPMLSELLEAMQRALGIRQHETAHAILLTYLYRPNGDTMVQRAEVRLEELFASEPRLLLQWPDVWSKARALRKRIQKSLGYFQQSLDLGGEPVAAFTAIAIALEQSGRIDDLLFACEIQRRMFDHAYVAESGVLASWVRIESDLPRAAIATSERWLPTDQIEARWLTGQLSATAERLALARVLAAWQLRDQKEMGAAGKVISELRKTEYKARLALHLSMATRRMGNKNADPLQLENSLRIVVTAAIQAPPPLNRPDFVAEFAPLWIDSMIGRGASEEEVLPALTLWRDRRADAIEPQLRTAEYLQHLGRTPAALAAIADASAIDPQHPELFPLHLTIARSGNDNSQQSGDDLLMQCIESRRTLPDARDPIGFVLCAEAALAQKNRRYARIALACARNAISSFPRANIPRQLELQALLLQQRYREAARTATLTISAIDPNPITLSLAIEAKKLAGESIRDLLRMAIPRITQNSQMQVELLRLALEDAPASSDRFVSADLTAKGATVGTRVLAIRSYCATGRLDDALKQIKACQPANNDEDHAELAAAFATWILLRSETWTDAELLAALQHHRQRLQLATGTQRAMLQVAQQLAESHPDTAFDALNTSLPTALPEERNGTLYILAGELALANQDAIRATSRWTAALGFADGQQIAERLARLYLLYDDEARALQTYALTKVPTDGALAARLGKPQAGAALLATALNNQPADLLAHAALATVGQPTLVDWKVAVDVEQQSLRLELISGLADPLLGYLCVPRAAALLKQDSQAKTSSLLMARAAVNAGDPAAAGFLHGLLSKAGCVGPVLWREVAFAGQQEGYATSKELLLAVMTATSSGRVASSPLTTLFGLRQIVKTFQEAGLVDAANKARLSQWKSVPQLRPCTADDLEVIVNGHTPLDVCLILNKILLGSQPCDRLAVLQQFYRTAEQLIAADQNHRAMLVRLATSHLVTEGALGEIVHFLLANAKSTEPHSKRDMMLALLERIATAKSDTTYLDRTITALTKSAGIVRANRELDALIDRYPTALPLWAARVALRQRLDDDPAALTELRTVLTHALDPTAELTFLGMAAARRKLAPADTLRLSKLPAELLASPAGEYVQGLMALRQGRADEAIERLLKAEPQHDGRHLYELALAYTMSAADQSRERAIVALEQLDKDYPKSSLARHARSFARQLSPQPVSASDNEENR